MTEESNIEKMLKLSPSKKHELPKWETKHYPGEKDAEKITKWKTCPKDRCVGFRNKQICVTKQTTGYCHAN